jgi:hypothetical protein
MYLRPSKLNTISLIGSSPESPLIADNSPPMIPIENIRRRGGKLLARDGRIFVDCLVADLY